MEIVEVHNRTGNLINELVEILEDSVRATHTFLANEEIEKIKEYVPQAIKEVSDLVIIKDENNVPVGFMGIEEQKLEMLFIKNSQRGKGLGKQLLNYGIEYYCVKELTVNEQNPTAKGFYEHLGFRTYKRSEIDEQGNPYPILYMRLDDKENVSIDVSLFFVVNGKFLIHCCKKEDGEKYGDFINYPQSHMEIWDKYYYKKYHVDFDYFPRGRVVYNIKENKYYVYHDKCIKDLSNIVGTEDKEKIEIREDFHYQCHKCNKNYII